MSFFDGIEDDLGDLAPHVRDELISGIHAERVMAAQSQRNIAEANERLEQACIEGLGQKMMSVDLSVWHFWNQKYPGCWKDKGFRRDIARDNPDVRVKYTPRSNVVRIDGFRDTSRESAPSGDTSEKGLVLA